MKNRTMQRRLLSLLLVAMLIITAGCQSVNGFDLNKAMQNNYAVQSSQGTQTVTMELIPNASAQPAEEEKQLLDLFSKVKLNLTEINQQDRTHVSVKGELEYNKGKIPFQMVMSDQDYTFLVDGAKKPIVVHNSVGAMEKAQETMSKEMQEQFKQLYKKSVDFVPGFMSYITGNLPNPKNIAVSDATETIHNEGLYLKRVHAEIRGNEVSDLIKSFLKNLLADEKGMKDILSQIYDMVLPLAQQAMKEDSSGSSAMNDMIAPYLNNKTLAVEFAFTFLKTNLQKAVDNYDQSLNEALNGYQGEELKKLLSEKQYVKYDMYVDNDLMPRKTSMEVSLTQLGSEYSAIDGLKITMTSELWNINKPVTVNAIDTSSGQLELTSLDKPGKILAALNPDSQLYRLLKNDLKITKKEITMFMDEESYYDGDFVKPYNRNGNVMVPARFVVEQLDADVAWDPATQQVTITDSITGTVIKLNIGSKQALVNGAITPMEVEAELENGTTFVPIRVIAEGMGAKVAWDQELQMVTITRD
ncbi:hypothetical protein SK3146_05508 [Paenibacillus konkukensis]|uniref:Copper amine oxidase-like N-terminal domain-containing protein n=1 Tax=Paenibacillus konkukensis TaxID=2020716 RepID=A0ABY4RWM8_9BACL|nr:copper amine oxidase N-terminal domain-containing protein [Paenibacillus konkukensis]UQZ86215.1 hypothetical protein SK3146_05508 [Paenibacillus konkukensis]